MINLHNKKSFFRNLKIKLNILKKKIWIFGGSSSGAENTNIQNAKTVGQLIAESNFDIVFG